MGRRRDDDDALQLPRRVGLGSKVADRESEDARQREPHALRGLGEVLSDALDQRQNIRRLNLPNGQRAQIWVDVLLKPPSGTRAPRFALVRGEFRVPRLPQRLEGIAGPQDRRLTLPALDEHRALSEPNQLASVGVVLACFGQGGLGVQADGEGLAHPGQAVVVAPGPGPIRGQE